MWGRDHYVRTPMIILAIDGLDIYKVEKYECSNLMLDHYGKTDITEFELPRTMVLWTSFMTGRNTEEEVTKNGSEAMWSTQYSIEATFFNEFIDPIIIDMPGFNYDADVHAKSRKLLANWFSTFNAASLDEYNHDAFNHHLRIKNLFMEALLHSDSDLIVGYFSLIDVIGHLNYINTSLMRIVYEELNTIAAGVRQCSSPTLIISDHGMVRMGQYGDHANDYGYWATNFGDIGTPRITDFRGIIQNENSIPGPS